MQFVFLVLDTFRFSVNANETLQADGKEVEKINDVYLQGSFITKREIHRRLLIAELDVGRRSYTTLTRYGFDVFE